MTSKIYGPTLAQNPLFLEALLTKLRPRQKILALSQALFSHYPPQPTTMQVLERESLPEPVPLWWSERVSVGSIRQQLSVAARSGNLTSPGDLHVPSAAWRSRWAEAIVDARPPVSVSEFKSLLYFAQGSDKARSSVLTPALTAAVKGGIAMATRQARFRREVAQLARAHVGSPFGPEAAARWRPLGDGLRKVRQWLAGEVLAIVFQHLTPTDRSLAYMVKPRRTFWSGYTGSVLRMWVAVTNSIRPQLQHPDVQRLRELMGDDLVICTLKGGPEQAVVWMQFDGRKGPVTVIEGNANTSLRIRLGAFEPPLSRLIYYKDNITQGQFRDSLAVRLSHDQHGRWRQKARIELLQYGIRRDGR
jgi:hypothetical protein